MKLLHHPLSNKVTNDVLDLVLFGGTGDLSWRKLMPALFQAFRHGKLPDGGRILAVARDERSDPDYRDFIAERFADVDACKRPSADEFARFAEMLHYRRMDLSRAEDYTGLREWIAARGADTVVMFLATSPHLFPVVCEQLGAAGLNDARTRVVLEKPLGHDLASAQQINRTVAAAFGEHQALRIDHYLGKPAVQNLSALRFGNALFEPLWRREHRQHPDHAGREHRRRYPRRLLRPHRRAARAWCRTTLRLLTMIAMEPPTGDADAITTKLKVLKSLKPSRPSAWRAMWCAASTAPARWTASRCPATWTRPRCSPTAAARPVALRTRCRTGAGRACPSLRTGKRLAGHEGAHRRQLPRGAAPDLSRCHRANKLVINLQRGRAGLRLMAARAADRAGCWPGVAGPGLRQGLFQRPRRRLRTPRSTPSPAG